MKMTLTQSQFVDEFLQVRPSEFSPMGLAALYDYYTDLEEDLGVEIEFDPVAICCDWAEYDETEIDTLSSDYDYLLADLGDEEKPQDLGSWAQILQEETVVILSVGGLGDAVLLVQAF